MSFPNDYELLTGPAVDGLPVSPNDSSPNLAKGPCRGVIIGTAGNLRCQFIQGITPVTIAVPAGQLSLRLQAIYSTGTTATGITALY